jgi:hypothetical protein
MISDPHMRKNECSAYSPDGQAHTSGDVIVKGIIVMGIIVMGIIASQAGPPPVTL